MSEFLCNKRETCRMAYQCGGAKPHGHCGECGKCPHDYTAKCVEIDRAGERKPEGT